MILCLSYKLDYKSASAEYLKVANVQNFYIKDEEITYKNMLESRKYFFKSRHTGEIAGCVTQFPTQH